MGPNHSPLPVALQAWDIPLFSNTYLRMESSDILEELSVHRAATPPLGEELRELVQASGQEAFGCSLKPERPSTQQLAHLCLKVGSSFMSLLETT